MSAYTAAQRAELRDAAARSLLAAERESRRVTAELRAEIRALDIETRRVLLETLRSMPKSERLVYSSDEERRDARRATWRRAGRKKWQAYVALCGRLGVSMQRARWTSHMAELRRLDCQTEGG